MASWEETARDGGSCRGDGWIDDMCSEVKPEKIQF